MGDYNHGNVLLARLRAVAHTHPGLFVALSFVAASVVYNSIPSETLKATTIESFVLALLAICLVVVWAPRTIHLPPFQTAQTIIVMTLYVLLVAAVGVFQNIDILATAFPTDLAFLVQRFVLVVIFCLATGVFEEGLFRVVAIGAFLQAFGKEGAFLRHPLLASAVVSAFLFGILHAGADMDGIFKSMQASLFGFSMAALYAETRSIWAPALVHALYNAVSMAPYLLVGCNAQSQLLSGDISIQVLGLSIVLLLPLAAYSFTRILHLEKKRI